MTPPRLVVSLSDKQLGQVCAAAATLRVRERDAFLRGIADQLRHRSISDSDVNAAIQITLGIRPYPTTKELHREQNANEKVSADH